MLIGGLLFARVFHIVFYEFSFYYSHPIEIFKIWSGGLSSFGGILGAGLGFWWYIRKKTELVGKRLLIIDQLSFATLYGWILGRFGCSFIHDHVGKLSDSFLAVRFPGGARLDMAIIEIICLIPLAILFFVLRKKNLFTGFYFSAVLVYYGVLRFILDFFRATDITQADARYLGLTPGQYFGILVAAIGLTMFGKVFLKKKK
jgi:phosphatidylglycerol:prolipoprotein diacylglycerol transferase